MEEFRVAKLASEIFDKKWQQKIKKVRVKNFYSPEEDEELYHQSYRNKYFFMLLENDPWEAEDPVKSTVDFTKKHFRLFKEFY
jgi:hypothetical protein